MTDSKNAWPGKQYAGSTTDYDEYDTDCKAWLIDKGYDDHMSSANPRNTPRVEQGFWQQDRRPFIIGGPPINKGCIAPGGVNFVTHHHFLCGLYTIQAANIL